MHVRFTKLPPGESADQLECIRPDGSVAASPLARQGILPHLAFHFIVESTLGWRDALYGRVAAGGILAANDAGVHGAEGGQTRNTQAVQAEALIECLEAAQWGGAADPAEFAQRLLRSCRKRGVTPPDITADELERVRLALRDFGAAWRPLGPGKSLERTF